MTCPRCQTETPADADFCPECGTKLALVCPSCNTANAPTHKFCKKCGQRLGAEAKPEQPAGRFASPESYTPRHLAERILTSKAALEGERKQVTILFADLKGSMELLADRDPEEARRLLDPVLEHMMEAVHRYEGTVNQVMGDGIMALFGAPLAHEDHAIRACYAALRMQESVKRYAETVRRDEGVTVRIRVGLNSGEVVVRAIGSDLHMDYTAVGQTTHLAARMEQLADPGAALLTADTLALAEGFIEVKSLGPMAVRGLAEPVRVHELIGASPVRSRLQAAAARGLTRFVGRDREIEALRQALRQAGHGHGQVVAVVGEPGVGKSRLVWEFTHSHRNQGWLVLETASMSYGKATTYSPVIELLRRYFGIESTDDTRRMREKVTGKLLSLDRAMEPTLPVFLSLLDVPVEDVAWARLDPSRRRQQTLDALKRLVLRESRVQPVLLVVEDLHWIDSETQAWLDVLVESLPTAPLLLLLNYRPEYGHGWGGKTYYQQVRLDALPLTSAGELLEALLGSGPKLEDLRRLLIHRTEGSPFFLEESVRALVESGALNGERGSYHLARPVQNLQLPATVQAIIAARIDRLAPPHKRLLQAAAVVGKDIPLPLLAAIADESEQELREGLTRLQAAEFLYESRLFPELEYTFKHALTHQVAYGSLLNERRRALHARLVVTLENLYGNRQVEQLAALANHAYRGEQWVKAARYAQLAGSEAVARSAHREAILMYQQAIKALGQMPEMRTRATTEIELRHGLRNAHLAIGDLEAIPAHMARALVLADELDDVAWRSRITVALSHYHWLIRDLPEALRLGERAVEFGVQTGDSVLAALARSTLGRVHFARGEFHKAVWLFEKSLEVQLRERPRGDEDMPAVPDVVTSRWLAQSLAELGSFEAAFASAREALAVAESLEHPYSLVNALTGLGVIMLRTGRFADAVPLFERTQEVSETFGFREFVSTYRTFGAHAYAGAGRLAEARAMLDTMSGITVSTSSGRARLSEAALAAEDLPQARQHAEAALALCRRQMTRSDEAWALYILGEIDAREGADWAASESRYVDAFGRATALDMRPLVAHCHLGLGKLHRRTDEREQAREHLTIATTMYREMGMTHFLEKAEAEMREVG